MTNFIVLEVYAASGVVDFARIYELHYYDLLPTVFIGILFTFSKV